MFRNIINNIDDFKFPANPFEKLIHPNLVHNKNALVIYGNKFIKSNI